MAVFRFTPRRCSLSLSLTWIVTILSACFAFSNSYLWLDRILDDFECTCHFDSWLFKYFLTGASFKAVFCLLMGNIFVWNWDLWFALLKDALWWWLSFLFYNLFNDVIHSLLLFDDLYRAADWDIFLGLRFDGGENSGAFGWVLFYDLQRGGRCRHRGDACFGCGCPTATGLT